MMINFGNQLEGLYGILVLKMVHIMEEDDQ